MTHTKILSLLSVGAISIWSLTAAVQGQAPAKPVVQIPDPGVPQAMTIQANFVRAAWNNEAYAILGYQIVNRSIGEEWLRLELGTTLLDNTPSYKLMREALSVDTPDGKNLPLPSIEEWRKADTRALDQRAKVQRDSINYFPSSAHQACRIGFFAELGSPAMPWDSVELDRQRACVGRVFFHMPGGITYGQYFLNVKFEKSVLRVPFKVFTKDEEKLLSKNYKSIKKQIDEAFKPKKK